MLLNKQGEFFTTADLHDMFNQLNPSLFSVKNGKVHFSTNLITYYKGTFNVDITSFIRGDDVRRNAVVAAQVVSAHTLYSLTVCEKENLIEEFSMNAADPEEITTKWRIEARKSPFFLQEKFGLFVLHIHQHKISVLSSPRLHAEINMYLMQTPRNTYKLLGLSDDGSSIDSTDALEDIFQNYDVKKIGSIYPYCSHTEDAALINSHVVFTPEDVRDDKHSSARNFGNLLWSQFSLNVANFSLEKVNEALALQDQAQNEQAVYSSSSSSSSSGSSSSLTSKPDGSEYLHSLSPEFKDLYAKWYPTTREGTVTVVVDLRQFKDYYSGEEEKTPSPNGKILLHAFNYDMVSVTEFEDSGPDEQNNTASCSMLNNPFTFFLGIDSKNVNRLV